MLRIKNVERERLTGKIVSIALANNVGVIKMLYFGKIPFMITFIIN